jgi:hypothetical protein
MEKQMNTLTRLAALSLIALMASTSLTLAVNVIDKPVLVDVIPPPLVEPPLNDHDLNDSMFNDYGINDYVLPGDDVDLSVDLASLNLVLACRIVDGDLLITNKGDPIPAGVKVKWKAAGQHGTVLLPNGLRADQKARIDIGLGIETGKCTVDVVR